MTWPVSAREWLADPGGTAARLFEPGGPVARAVAAEGGSYAHNPVQADYAAALARTAARGADPSASGKVTPLEASTGVGKSLAILCVAGINAVLRRKPALVTTYTRFLNRQIAGRDGRIAAAAVAEAVGRAPAIRLYRPRTAFASASRIEASLALLAHDEAADIQGVPSALCREALERLGEWAERAARVAADDPDTLVGGLDGLVETFVETHPRFERALRKLPYDLYALEPLSPAAEQAPFEAYARDREGADVLVATHAALVRQITSGGKALFGGEGFSLAVIDEANRIEEAGRLALGVTRSVGSLARETRTLLSALSGAPLPDEVRQQAAAVMVDRHLPAVESAVADIREGAARSQGGWFAVRGDEPFLARLAECSRAASEALALLKPYRRHQAVAGAMDQIERRESDVAQFLECAEAHRRKAETGGVLPDNMRFLDMREPRVVLSPSRREPSLTLRPKAGARAVGLLWRGSGFGADAVAVTSATLATPGLEGADAFSAILRAVGLSPGSSELNSDLMGRFEMAEFGRLEEVVLADPSAPLPFAREDDGVALDPAWTGYAAAIVLAAAEDRYKGGSSRVVALASSFAEARLLGEAIAARGGNAIVRTEADPVEAGFDALAQAGDGVLVTVGAFDGVNRPGLIDHLVIPRLPFPASQDGGSRPFAFSAAGGARLSQPLETMMRMLRQGIGRAFRVADDRAKVWIADPRIGLPAGMEARDLVFPHPKSRRIYLLAFPGRFAGAVSRARIFPYVEEGRMAS